MKRMIIIFTTATTLFVVAGLSSAHATPSLAKLGTFFTSPQKQDLTTPFLNRYKVNMDLTNHKCSIATLLCLPSSLINNNLIFPDDEVLKTSSSCSSQRCSSQCIK